MAPSGISINKPAAIAIVSLVAGGLIFYYWGWSVHHLAVNPPETVTKPAAGKSVCVCVANVNPSELVTKPAAGEIVCVCVCVCA